MEAVPRLPMVSFDLKLSPERTAFAPKLKQYIADAYNEDPESYANEIRQLEALRRSAVPPTIDITGLQTLTRYFCQLHFLQSRFPMGKGEVAAVTFSWRDIYASMVCSLADIKFELVAILYNIGALHTQLGALDPRTTSDGLKMTCTHFQCAAWAFQNLRENYPQPAGVDLAPEVMQYMHQLCLAQAQECILEKSMLDNRKATIIAKVAVQVVDYYNQALNTLNMGGGDEGSIAETVGSKIFKEWTKYLKFKIAYHTCISLLYQGQQAEEQQKMGERVAFYHAASQELENARKLSKGLDNKSNVAGITEALTFTMDVVEGKKKAATNENEFIYHEEVPERDTLQLVKGASLVKGIPFSFNDVEVSGPDIFGRLVPMMAHEASSIYSEEKAQLLRTVSAQVEEKDNQLVGYVASLQLDNIEQAAQIIIQGGRMTDLPQEIVDRAALLNANVDAIQKLVQAMATLANLYHDVEAMLDEIQQYFQEEESNEKEYQTAVGHRPPSMLSTELKREAGKYREAHTKANESNQTLHRAMTLHVNNLKLLALPFDELRQHIPTIKVPDPNINVDAVKELHMLINKIDEMRQQRVTLLQQLRESITKDDVTGHIVTKPTDQPLDVLFEQEMQKHQHIVKLIEQNMIAQENIMQAMTDAYARHSNTRKTIIDLLKQRETTIHALTSSYDAYEDLLSKANKGIDFYKKLETNVAKLLQRVKSTCKVQSEERETILAKNKPTPDVETTSASSTAGGTGGGYKLKDYLASMKREPTIPTVPYIPSQQQPVIIPSVRPAPVGSEGTNEIMTKMDDKTTYKTYPTPSMYAPGYENATNYYYNPQASVDPTIKSLEERMATLMAKSYGGGTQQNYQQYPQASPAVHYSPHQYPANYPAGVENPQYPQYGAGAPGQYTNNYPGSYQAQYPGTNYPVTSTPNAVQYPTNYPVVTSSNQGAPGYGTQNSSTYPASSSASNQAPGYPNNNYPSVPTSTQSPGYPTNYPVVTSSNQGVPGYATQTIATYPAVSSAANQAPGYPSNNYPSVPSSTQPPGYPTNYSAAMLSNYPSMAPSNQGGVPGYATQSTSTYPNQNYPSVTSSNYPINYPKALGYAGQSTSTYSTSTSNLNQSGAYHPSNQTPEYAAATHTTSTYSSSQYPASYPSVTPSTQSTAYPTSYTSATSSSQAPGYQTYTNSTYTAQNQYPAPSTQSNAYLTSYPSTTSSNQAPGYQTYPNQYPNNYPSVTAPSTYSNQSYYPGHGSGYGYDPTTGQYLYNFATTIQTITPSEQLGATVYTSAGANAGTTQTPSEQYAASGNEDGVHQVGAATNYYSVPYGQHPLTYTNSSSSNAGNNNTQTTPVMTTSAAQKPESNIDLLADIDFNIPYAPLTPQSHPQIAKEVPSTTSIACSLPPIDVVVETSTKEDTTQAVVKDPLDDPEMLNQFTQDVEKFEKFVENLTNKTLNGPTPLDMKWKELQDLQDKDGLQLNISVARCYPIKNRFPDILPFDYSRVEMPSTKDDYINASHVKNITPYTPGFILTQAPLQTTLADFWTMIWEQQCEIIVCLLNDTELQDVYFPKEKGDDVIFGRFRCSLESCNVKVHCIERTITMCMLETKMTRVIIHLQFISWPGISFPTSPGPFLAFVCDVLTFHSHQRSKEHPIVVHCDSGIGRSGLLCLLAAYILQPAPLPADIVKLVSRISQHRKQSLRDREHLKFAYQAILYHAQDLLMKRGILTSRSTFQEAIKPKTQHTRHPSQDLLFGATQTIERRNSLQGGSGSEEGQTSTSSTCSNATVSKSMDPLSSLDPLWALRTEGK